jgi:hypothetical protein
LGFLVDGYTHGKEKRRNQRLIREKKLSHLGPELRFMGGVLEAMLCLVLEILGGSTKVFAIIFSIPSGQRPEIKGSTHPHVEKGTAATLRLSNQEFRWLAQQ